MDYYYEGVEYTTNFDFKIFLHNVYTVKKHWHNDIEVIFVLKGTIEVGFGEQQTILSEGNILLLNPNVIHSIRSTSENLLLVLQMQKEVFYNISKINIDIDFKYISFEEMHTKEYREVSKLLANMALIYVNKDENKLLLLKSLFFRFIYILSKHNNIDSIQVDENSVKDLNRLLDILQVAKEHYTENISLAEYAKMFGLTTQYFANYFKKNFGESFIHYINDLRVEKATALLLETDKSMTEISTECGFTNIKSFNTLFKQKIGTPPSDLRKKGYESRNQTLIHNLNYFEIKTNAPLKELDKYLKIDDLDKNTSLDITRRIRVDISKETCHINHNWKNLITVGRASQILDSGIQKVLTETQNEIGFTYIRFHGLFDDDMLIYNLNEEGLSEFNFYQVEKLVDFLLSINLKPFFELGFMPTKLASEDRTIFYFNNNLSTPININIWKELVENLLKFLTAKYGKREVESWFFEFWNEPDILPVFGFNNFNKYLEFYKETYETFKNVNVNIKIGGPSILVFSYFDSIFTEYLNFCKTNNCMPDFLTGHLYPFGELLDTNNTNYISEDIFSNSQLGDLTGVLCGISEDVNYLENQLIKLKEFLEKENLKNLPFYITEWNSTFWHRDLCSDTTYKSAYIVKNICNSMDMIDGLGYWMLSDFSQELFPSKHLFHGGLGLFTQNGLKKPGYYAFDFLNRLGSEFIEKGKMHYVTKEDDSYQILIHNYCHYDSNYRKFDNSLIDIKDRTNVFNGNNVTVQLIIDNLETGSYKLKVSKISTQSGSVYDEWIKIGSPDILQPKEVIYLKNKSEPNFTITTLHIDKTFEKFINFEKNEVVLIELVKN